MKCEFPGLQRLRWCGRFERREKSTVRTNDRDRDFQVHVQHTVYKSIGRHARCTAYSVRVWSSLAQRL